MSSWATANLWSWCMAGWKITALGPRNSRYWQRIIASLPTVVATISRIGTFNDYEKAFSKFLERSTDVPRFASLGTTEQESGAQFRVDYLKPSGAIGFYYPDWVVVRKTKDGEVNWIIETK